MALTRIARAACIAAALAVACAPPVAPGTGAEAPPLVAVDEGGTVVDVRAAARAANATVIELFSAHCPSQRVHDRRLGELYEQYAPRGVRFFAVDAEAGASPERARREAIARGYRFPLLADPDGAIARALGAAASTHTVVLDRDARIRYAGAIDSDRMHLTADARFYLRDAIDDVLAGRAPRVSETKPLGCALTR